MNYISHSCVSRAEHIRTTHRTWVLHRGIWKLCVYKIIVFFLPKGFYHYCRTLDVNVGKYEKRQWKKTTDIFESSSIWFFFSHFIGEILEIYELIQFFIFLKPERSSTVSKFLVNFILEYVHQIHFGQICYNRLILK